MDAPEVTVLEPGMLLLDSDGALGGRPMIWTVKSKYTLVGYSEGVLITGQLTRKPGLPKGFVLLDGRRLAAHLADGKQRAFAA